MASTITNYSALIDSKFPVAGANNDIQGFKNNFQRIKSALETTSREIENLKEVGVFLTENLNFNNNIISSATIIQSTIILKS